jgi:hypothetical protein
MGAADLITANSYANTLTVFTNAGNGKFLISTSPIVGSFPRAVTAVDINDDGKLDLVNANSGTNWLTILTNAGQGFFVLSSTPTVGSGIPYPEPRSLTAADFNGDGKLNT